MKQIFARYGALLVLALLTAATAGCRTDYVAKEPVYLSERAYKSYRNYLELDTPLAFAVTEDGQDTYIYYCKSFVCTGWTGEEVVRKCEEEHPQKTCHIIDTRGKALTDIHPDPGKDYRIDEHGVVHSPV